MGKLIGYEGVSTRAQNADRPGADRLAASVRRDDLYVDQQQVSVLMLGALSVIGRSRPLGRSPAMPFLEPAESRLSRTGTVLFIANGPQ